MVNTFYTRIEPDAILRPMICILKSGQNTGAAVSRPYLFRLVYYSAFAAESFLIAGMPQMRAGRKITSTARYPS